MVRPAYPDTPPSFAMAGFFDLDKTIIAGSSALAFGKPLYRAGFLHRGTLLRLGIAQISYLPFGADESSLERARDEMLDLVSGWHKAEIESIIAKALDDVIEPLVFAEVLFLIDEHKRAGRAVYVVSASPEEFVTPIAAMVGIDGVIATRIRTDRLGATFPNSSSASWVPGRSKRYAGSLSAMTSTCPGLSRTPTVAPTSRCSRSSGTRSS